MLDTLTLACPAKINLALSVGPPRPADGYHAIASWMMAVTFSDTLTLTRQRAGLSRFEIAFANDAPVAQTVDWPLKKDLAFRAHALLEQETKQPLGVHAQIAKRIPTGAGLGGGSANAAAMLVGLNTLFDLGVAEDRLRILGATLGCDVAFSVSALQGQTSAIATGLGEILEPAPPTEPIYFVLIFPPFGCPTGQVYQAFDQEAQATQPQVDRVRQMAWEKPFNDLADPAMRAVPALRAIHQQVTHVLKRPIYVTGSGSTLFALTRHQDEANALAQTLTTQTPLACAVAGSL